MKPPVIPKNCLKIAYRSLRVEIGLVYPILLSLSIACRGLDGVYRDIP
jgi:hypothetical protein